MAELRTMVPCGACRACCRHEMVILMPEQGDDPTLEHEEIEMSGKTLRVLRRRPNGDCVYLDDDRGCTIHERAPVICRKFDCRAYFLSMSRNERRVHERMAGGKEAIFEAGRARLPTLTPQARADAMRHAVGLMALIDDHVTKPRGARA